MSYIMINDEVVPTPMRGISINRTPMLKTTTNAKGETIAQIINSHRMVDFGTLQWNYLTASQWNGILLKFKTNPVGTITFYDEEQSGWIKLQILFKGSSEEPYTIDDNGIPIDYINCKLSIEDIGKEGVTVDVSGE